MKHYSDIKAAPTRIRRERGQEESKIKKKQKEKKESKKPAQGIDRNREDLQGLVLVPF